MSPDHLSQMVFEMLDKDRTKQNQTIKSYEEK